MSTFYFMHQTSKDYMVKVKISQTGEVETPGKASCKHKFNFTKPGKKAYLSNLADVNYLFVISLSHVVYNYFPAFFTFMIINVSSKPLINISECLIRNET